METWEEILKEIVLKGISLAEKTGEFAISQAPDLLQQFYRWHIIDSSMGIVLAILFFLSGRYVPHIWLHKSDDNARDRWGDKLRSFFSKQGSSDGLTGAFICFIVGLIVSVTMLIINIYNLAYILSAPKLYLLDYFIK